MHACVHACVCVCVCLVGAGVPRRGGFPEHSAEYFSQPLLVQRLKKCSLSSSAWFSAVSLDGLFRDTQKRPQHRQRNLCGLFRVSLKEDQGGRHCRRA